MRIGLARAGFCQPNNRRCAGQYLNCHATIIQRYDALFDTGSSSRGWLGWIEQRCVPHQQSTLGGLRSVHLDPPVTNHVTLFVSSATKIRGSVKPTFLGTTGSKRMGTLVRLVQIRRRKLRKSCHIGGQPSVLFSMSCRVQRRGEHRGACWTTAAKGLTISRPLKKSVAFADEA